MHSEDLKGKIKNMYIMLLFSIMTDDIDRVKQYLSDDLVAYYKDIVRRNIDANISQKYGELNVASVSIEGIKDDIITARIEAKYIDYRVNRKTKKFIDGDEEKTSHFVTLKIRHQKENRELVYRCKSCGAMLNINLTGICQYCDEPVDDSESVYVIESIIHE